MNGDRYDVTIIGAGPAGATAAILLARKDYSVVLLDRSTFPRPVRCAGWLSSRADPLLKELGLHAQSLLDRPFRDVTLHNADFSKSARPQFNGSVGYLVDRAKFDSALSAAAAEHGTVFHQGCAAVDIRLNESSVAVSLSNQQRVSSRLLVLASGRGSELLERIGFPREPKGTPFWTAQVEADLSPGAKNTAPHVHVVLGLDGGASFGLICIGEDRVVLNVNWMGDRALATHRLVNVCRTAFEHRLVPVDLSKQAGTAAVLRSPAAAALDMESHVGKHTLLIGDAGGFVSAASNEGIYPAMWSAQLAAQAVDAALQSPYSQDALMNFDSLWRMQMADHLRSPHTDIRFLLPLIFSNQPMADRMGAAFFFGENI